METIILKIVILSTVLLGFYHFFLAKERIFKFNRIFLVSSLLFAYSVPFIPMPTYFESSNQPNLIFGEPVQQFQQVGVNTAQHFDWSNLILGVYLSISTLFLVKFIHFTDCIIIFAIISKYKRETHNCKIFINQLNPTA